MNDPEVRIARCEDADVVAVLVGAFRDHLHESLPTDAELGRQLPASLADPNTEFCCAWLEARPVGYAHTRFSMSLWALGIEAHLEDLFVLESARGRSIGRELMRFALARAQKRGARVFSLNTNERNESAHRLYRSEGLQPQSHALWPGGQEVRWVKKLVAS